MELVSFSISTTTGDFDQRQFFIYLNDLPDDDAGETYFPVLQLKFKPSKGCAIMWTNTYDGKEDMRMVHQGLPPRTHMKFGVNCFFNEKPLKRIEALAMEDQDDSQYKAVDPQSLIPKGKSLEPGKIYSFAVSDDPKIAVVPSFLSLDEVNALMAVLTKEPVDDAEVYSRIEQRCAMLARLPVAHLEPIKVAKSEPDTTPDGVIFSGDEKGSYMKKFGQKIVDYF